MLEIILENLFTISIVFSIFIFITPYLFRRKGISELQVTVTTMGIVGTFLGILLSLWFFDVNNITEAVPKLLDGLRFAFLTSVSGIFTSLLLSLVPKLYFLGESKAEEDLTETDLLAQISEDIKQLNRSITGDEDSTLLTQMQKLRTSVVDKQEELNQAFREFAEKMVEDNSKSLIEALEGVMRDFNTRINEQFGDNFKQLNQAVGKILEWQENYKNQITESTTALQSAKEAMNTSSKSLEEITAHAQSFESIADQLKESLEATSASMSAIKNLSDTLSGSGENIRKEMKNITETQLEQLGDNLAAISEKLAVDYERVQKAMSNIGN